MELVVLCTLFCGSPVPPTCPNCVLTWPVSPYHYLPCVYHQCFIFLGLFHFECFFFAFSCGFSMLARLEILHTNLLNMCFTFTHSADIFFQSDLHFVSIDVSLKLNLWHLHCQHSVLPTGTEMFVRTECEKQRAMHSY